MNVGIDVFGVVNGHRDLHGMVMVPSILSLWSRRSKERGWSDKKTASNYFEVDVKMKATSLAILGLGEIYGNDYD